MELQNEHEILQEIPKNITHVGCGSNTLINSPNIICRIKKGDKNSINNRKNCNLKDRFCDYAKYEYNRIKNVLNNKDFAFLIYKYKDYFKKHGLLCIVSLLNVLVIISLLVTYFFLFIVTFLPVLFLFLSFLIYLIPLMYPLIKDKIDFYYKEEIVFCTCIIVGSIFFSISILFIWFTPLISIFLYPLNGIFLPIISTSILPIMWLLNACVCIIYVIFYTDLLIFLKNKIQNIIS